MKIIRVDGRPHLCLFALKDINPGEEITYNNGDSDWPWRNKVLEIKLYFQTTSTGTGCVILLSLNTISKAVSNCSMQSNCN